MVSCNDVAKTGDTYSFNTNRGYDENGQIIELTIIGEGNFLGCGQYIIRMKDISRNLDYVYCVDVAFQWYKIRQYVMEQYDNPKIRAVYYSPNKTVLSNDLNFMDSVTIY